MRRRSRLVITLYVSVAVATTGVVLVLWAGEAMRSTDLETVDARFSVRGARGAGCRRRHRRQDVRRGQALPVSRARCTRA